jgi:hypothetical protein
VCYNSPFEVLTDPVSSGNLYTRGYRLTEDSKEEVLSAARSLGSCGTCANGYDSSMLSKGFRAVMVATVLDMNLDDDDAPPLIIIDAMKPSNDLGDDPCQTEYDMVEGVGAASPVTDEPPTTLSPSIEVEESSAGETLSLKQFHAIACFIISAILL